jgi:predicted DNA-binding transcriptional regulator AlpA
MQSNTSIGASEAEQFLPARRVWERYGVSEQSLWRWIHDEKLDFPPPIYIRRFRYWRLSDLIAWERSRQSHNPGRNP